MNTKPHVGVIGAGLAGLRCADILIQNGVEVTILEARNRIGGRVHQDEVGGYSVDLGPNWIHGTGDNPIMSIAETTQTITHDPEGRNLAISREGHLIRDELATKASEFMWTTIEQAFEYSNLHGESIPPDRSLYDFFQEKVEQSGFSVEEKQLCLDACLLWGAYVGDPVQRQSLKFFRLEECIDGNNYFVASTYKHILAHVAKTALAHADIRFNQPVVHIEAPSRNNNSVSIKPKVIVTTATGEQHHFDEVVVTCPLGWLKRNTEAFTPALPARLIQAINNSSYGRLEKVYITFPHAFWHQDTTSSSSSSSSSSSTADKPRPQSQNQMQIQNPVFVQFLQPSYTTHPPEIQWNQECLSLAILPKPTTQPTLLFYTYGPSATHILTQLTPYPRNSPEYTTTLQSIFEPFYSRLPGYIPNTHACTPTSFLATTWQNDPYAGNGSYCNFQVGATGADRDIEVLRCGAGIGSERGVWFAGEHTAPFVALGTTTGAYWSGERVAGEVCGQLGLGSGLLQRGGRDDSLPSGCGG